VPINRWMGKKNVAYIHSRVLFTQNGEQNYTFTGKQM
jgi:hypothetical protein